MITARIDSARSISDVLAGLDDAGARTLIDAAEPVGAGIGGTTKTARITPAKVASMPTRERPWHHALRTNFTGFALAQPQNAPPASGQVITESALGPTHRLQACCQHLGSHCRDLRLRPRGWLCQVCLWHRPRRLRPHLHCRLPDRSKSWPGRCR